MDAADRDRESAATLRRLERNDPALRSLVAVGTARDGEMPAGACPCHPASETDLARLGAALGDNTVIRGFYTRGGAALAEMAVGNDVFWEGLEKNASIIHLEFYRTNRLGEFENEIMNRMAYKDHLEGIGVVSCELDTKSVDALASVLSRCTNLDSIGLVDCNVPVGLLGEFAMRLRGLHRLRELFLNRIDFPRTGCAAIATLLRDPKSNLVELYLSHDPGIDDDCARLLAESLGGNRKLETLDLSRCAVTASGLESAFSEILCDASAANETHLSNHTLRGIGYHRELPTDLSSLFGLNPIEKILRAHAHLDVTKLLEWDQKLLPRALLWLGKARRCPTAGSHDMEAKSLSVAYQFVRAFPMTAVPPTLNELDEIARHHGLGVVENKNGYVVGDRVYVNYYRGPWGYVVGHTRSSVFVTMNHTSIEDEIIHRNNFTVCIAPMLIDEPTLAARRQREQLNAPMLIDEATLEQLNGITLSHGLKRDWNEDGYAVGDRVCVNPFVGTGNCTKRHCGIRGYVVGHTRSSVWIATDHTCVDAEIIKRRSSRLSKAPLHR